MIETLTSQVVSIKVHVLMLNPFRWDDFCNIPVYIALYGQDVCSGLCTHPHYEGSLPNWLQVTIRL